MHRREVLGKLAVAAAAWPVLRGLRPDELLALGERTHERLAERWAYQPVALDAHEFRTASVVAELIIPETETPGATSAGVDRFIDLMVAEWFDDGERAAFRAGLSDLDARSRAAFGSNFVAGSSAQQTSLLERLEADSLELREADPARAENLFFPRMKWLTLLGYYTSERGATEEHHWVAIPGAYRGCEPF